MTTDNGSAAAGNPAPGAGGTGAAAGDAPWYSGIADEGLRGYVQNKAFKDPAALAESYRNLEKLQGVPQERLLKLPERSDDPAWGDVYTRLGKPAEAKEYGLQFEGDPAFAERFSGVFHEANITKPQAAKLNEAWNSYVAELLQQEEQARTQKDEAEMAELRTKWGQTFDQNAELGRRAGREFGLSEDEFKAISASLGSGKTLELFQRIGSKLGEAAPFDPAGTGGRNGFGMTPEQAKSRISALTADKDWGSKYLSGGVAEREEMERLQKIAAGQQA